MSISLCIITKNEEQLLERCLNSISPIVDEIIVVDIGSTDATKDIARYFTKHVYEFEFQDNFAAARNFALEKTSKDWILVLDADETISQQDQYTIKELSQNQEAAAYSFSLRTYAKKIHKKQWFDSANDSYKESRPYAGWTQKKSIRLFRNDPAIRFEGIVNESILLSLRSNGHIVHDTSLPIHKQPTLRNPEQQTLRQKYILKLLMKKAKEWPTSNAYYELAEQLEGMMLYQAAKLFYEKAIALDPSYAMIAK